MTATILQHPASREFVAILGGPGCWFVCRAIGDRGDGRYPDVARFFAGLAEAREHAQAIADEHQLDVELRPCRTGGGEAA